MILIVANDDDDDDYDNNKYIYVRVPSVYYY